MTLAVKVQSPKIQVAAALGKGCCGSSDHLYDFMSVHGLNVNGVGV